MQNCECEQPLIKCDNRGCHCTRCGRPERRRLLAQANNRQVGGDHYRSAYQHWDFIEECGIDVNARGFERITPLHMLVSMINKLDENKDIAPFLATIQCLIELCAEADAMAGGRMLLDTVALGPRAPVVFATIRSAVAARFEKTGRRAVTVLNAIRLGLA